MKEALDPDRVRDRLAAAREQVAAAARLAGREPEDVEILAATKYVALADMAALADAGVTLVGENRVQDLLAKQRAVGDRFSWDFIGHLQSRKTQEVAGRVRLIHSVESLSVVRRLARHGTRGTGLLLEVNLAGEQSKFGVPPGEVESFLQEVTPFEEIGFKGLMTMPPLVEDPEKARHHFTQLRELGEKLSAAWSPRHEFGVLSMGTSQDFAVAVEEGATIVRIGSTLYGGFQTFQANSAR